MRYSDRHISDEELDQLFRDTHASEGPEALFVPEFWSEMEAMLPAEKTKKRGFYWIPLAATAVLFGVILFYPPNPVQIDRLEQNSHLIQNDQKSNLNPNSVSHSDSAPVIAENATASETHISETTPNKQQIKTTFRTQKKQIPNQRLDNKKDAPLVEEAPQNPMDGNRIIDNPENSTVALDPPSVFAPPSVSLSDLDSLNLEARYESVPHEDVVPLPKKRSNESNEWYLELGPTVGQSPYLSPNQKRNAVGGAVLGAGYTKRIDNAFVSFGLQARMEGFGGLEYRETNFSPNIVRTVSVKQLYSLEVPLRFGYTFRRSEISVGVVPGVQLFIHGKEQITENQVIQRQGSFTGKVEHSNSLTMEFGFQYYYNFTSRWSVGAKVNADILRPFHTDYYLGKSTGLPVNGQIVLRTRLSK